MDLGSMRYQNRSQSRGSLSSHKVPLFYRGLAKLLFSSLQTLERKVSFVILLPILLGQNTSQWKAPLLNSTHGP